MAKPYERDFFAWTQAQADALKRRSVGELDWDNVREEIESLGKQERNELRSHLIVLLVHLLKWRLQPERRGRSWALSVKEQRREIERLLRENPSLQPQADEVLSEAYDIAVVRAARETDLPESAFPDSAPFGLNEAMSLTIDWPEPGDGAGA